VASLLFRACGNNNPDSTVTVTPPKELKKQVEDTAAKYGKQISELGKQIQQLQQDLNTAHQQLQAAKQTTKKRAAKIKQLIAPVKSAPGYPAKQLLQKVKPDKQDDNAVSPCDSLVREVSEYLNENIVKDSLYEDQIQKLDSIVHVKDAIIQNHQQLYSSLNKIFSEAVAQQELLLKENKRLKKKARRKKFGNTLKTIGVIIATAAATNYINNH